MRPCILMRPALEYEDEYSSATQYFPTHSYRTDIPKNSLVIGRYSCLPFYGELEHDLKTLGSRLINSYAQHQYVANFDYYYEIADVTFPTWFKASDIPREHHADPFIVKGATNSRKQQWATKMFANNFRDAVQIGAELACDGLIGQQTIIYRKFQPLETFEYQLNGMPVTNEWRIFYLNGQRLCDGYYWGSIDDWTPVENARADFEANGRRFADAIAQRIKTKIPFVVMDIAKRQDGSWCVVELNDAQQSGLNDTIDSCMLYTRLSECLN